MQDEAGLPEFWSRLSSQALTTRVYYDVMRSTEKRLLENCPTALHQQIILVPVTAIQDNALACAVQWRPMTPSTRSIEDDDSEHEYG